MKTAFVIVASLLLVLAACGQKAPSMTAKTGASAQTAGASAQVTDTDVQDIGADIDGISTDTVDTSALDSLDDDLAAIDALDI